MDDLKGTGVSRQFTIGVTMKERLYWLKELVDSFYGQDFFEKLRSDLNEQKDQENNEEGNIRTLLSEIFTIVQQWQESEKKLNCLCWNIRVLIEEKRKIRELELSKERNANDLRLLHESLERCEDLLTVTKQRNNYAEQLEIEQVRETMIDRLMELESEKRKLEKELQIIQGIVFVDN